LVENPYDQFVSELLASYASVGGLNNRDAHNMPSTRTVGQICEDLLQLLFPGFHDDDAVHHGSLAELTGERLSKVALSLEDQVRKSVRIGDPKKPTGRLPTGFAYALPTQMQWDFFWATPALINLLPAAIN
jgi:serine O-acetyltransferase